MMESLRTGMNWNTDWCGSDDPSTTQVSGPKFSIRSHAVEHNPRAGLEDDGNHDSFDFFAINALTVFKEFSLACMSLFALATSILL